jgi:hypothetical protein
MVLILNPGGKEILGKRIFIEKFNEEKMLEILALSKLRGGIAVGELVIVAISQQLTPRAAMELYKIIPIE